MHKKFICPHCCSTHLQSQLNVSPPSGDGPWDHVHTMDRCGQCDSTIPTHLSRRFNMTKEKARLQYKTDKQLMHLLYEGSLTIH
tara:strand:- start:159 stop:410 length:252 start_codon:yes stop_codon:yes gene_type:complete